MLRIFPEIEAARRRPAHPDFARPRSLPAKGNDGGSPGRNARTLPPGYLPAAE